MNKCTDKQIWDKRVENQQDEHAQANKYLFRSGHMSRPKTRRTNEQIFVQSQTNKSETKKCGRRFADEEIGGNLLSTSHTKCIVRQNVRCSLHYKRYGTPFCVKAVTHRHYLHSNGRVLIRTDITDSAAGIRGMYSFFRLLLVGNSNDSQ